MKANTQPIKGVFMNSSLMIIPYYQRRYVWDEKNWERFFNDMTETVNSDTSYFLGAIILKEESVTKQDRLNGVFSKSIVVDGQQRLTTLAIFMKILHYLTGDAHQIQDFDSYYLQNNPAHQAIIEHNCEDRPEFSKIMTRNTLSFATNGNSRICQAYNYFLQQLKDYQKAGNGLANLLSSIYASVNFVVISLDQDDDEQQIFDTLNSLGVSLTTDELLKNFLYSTQDEQIYRATWRKMFDTDEAHMYWGTDASTAKTSKKDTVMDRFLQAFVRIKMWDFKDKLTTNDRIEFVRNENVYRACKAFVERFGMNKLYLADEILGYAEIYQKYFDESVLDKRDLPKVGCIERLILLVITTQTFSAIPYILYILKNVTDQNERNDIFGYLETYLVRKFIRKDSTKSYRDFFSENLIGNHIKSYDELKKYVSSKPQSANLAMPDKKELEGSVPIQTIDPKIGKVILYLYETKLNINFSFNECTVTLLMPSPTATSAQNWPLDPSWDVAAAKTTIKGLGNLFLLGNHNGIRESEIKRANNQPFANKKALVEKYNNNIGTDQILKNKNSWTLDDIIRRDELLAKAINENIWPSGL